MAIAQQALENLQSACERRASTYYMEADRHYGRYFKAIPITFSNRMTKTAGMFIFTDRGSKEIRLSNPIMSMNFDAFIERTVGHEVAHHIVHELHGRVQPHGKEWKEVMAVFGLEAKRCHSYKVESNKVEYIVDGKSYFLGKIQHGRCQRGQVYINNKTKARIVADAWVGSK